MQFTNSHLLALGIQNGTSDSSLGDMKSPEAQTRFFSGLKLDRSRFLFLHQIHGAEILEVHDEKDFAAYSRTPRRDADAWIMTLKNCGVVIQTADCVPLFMWDESARVLGLAHCGWRGVTSGLPEKLAARMSKLTHGRALSAHLGPHIRSCCFEIGTELKNRFAPAALSRKDGRLFADLSREIAARLAKAGIPETHLSQNPFCTKCSGEKLHSFRRTQRHDAMLSYVFMP